MPKTLSESRVLESDALTLAMSDDDDDFQNPNQAISLTQNIIFSSLQNPTKNPSSQPLKPSNGARSSKKPKRTTTVGKENCEIPNTLATHYSITKGCDEMKGFKSKTGYFSNSIESRLLESGMKCDSTVGDSGLEGDCSEDFEPGTQLNVLINLCTEMGEVEDSNGVDFTEGNDPVECPLCGIDISDLREELRQVHTNDCLDRNEISKVIIPSDIMKPNSAQQIVDVTPVLEFLHRLGLSRYEEAFAREEIDWDTLQWLTEEDLLSLGVTALGPRKKIVHALKELKERNMHAPETHADTSKIIMRDPGNKLITQFFHGSVNDEHRDRAAPRPNQLLKRSNTASSCKRGAARNQVSRGRIKDIPPWCCISGTPFRVDAFRYLRGDCSHWFLTHFHIDHYQGLTRGFCHGKIYCSSITACLVNLKIGVPWDRLEVLPINKKISIAGTNVTCLDANHCPGSIIILFEPPNSKAVLHTGDFRFSEEMASSSFLQSCRIHTLILDTTYCNPQYDFPKQEAVIQFVLEAIQAEAFNPKTLFLVGSYTIGKERLFVEVARFLRKKVYVGAAKLRLLECLGIPKEDMQWFTVNEQESHIHVVPMWTIASFKRMKYISNQYSSRFNLIVAFSPTGWTFGKGKKKSPWRKWQQGTIIRYEVPYSEHCSFTELKEFVRFISPENIVPSVNNNSPESADAMVALLMSDS
ncbi:sterile alpha motif (SAM) domain-containing protein [Tasmannia lanceolata]|uniref:sterile alpha motif (SAM) domain-containing protein n=1 Tax=Tasmannia lanceolata TaxID=3420 RepID=UPI004062ED68